MRVQEIILQEGTKRYIVIDDQGDPVPKIVAFMKYLECIQMSVNTQRTYCYGLKDFYTYLQLTDSKIESVTINTLAHFLSWLVNPTVLDKVIHFKHPTPKAEKTINLRITTVLSFFRFLYQFEYIDKDLTKQAYREFRGIRTYKDFLYHINKNKLITKNILRVKEPKDRPKVIPDSVIQKAFGATNNSRDLFLVYLLYESGLRIGEVLSLHKEDIVFNLIDGHRIQLKYRGTKDRETCLKGGERTILVSAEVINLFDDYMYDISDFDNSSSLFIKLKGTSKGMPMNYSDVAAVFRRISKKIDYTLHPHLYRHTHATKYFKETGNIKAVQERLGHRQIQTTMNLYLHSSEKEVREQWEKARKVFKLEEN